MRTLLLVLALCAAGCATWRPQGLTPEAVIAREHPQGLRIAAGTGPVLEMRKPRVEGDSLVGEVDGARKALALRDVTRVEAARADAARVLVPFVFSFGVGVLLFVAASQ